MDMFKKHNGQLPLVSRFVFETDDLLATRDNLANYLVQHTINPLEKNYNVRFRHCSLDVGEISINSLQYGAAIRIGVSPPADTFLLLILLEGSGTVKQDGYITHINNQRPYVFNPGIPAVLELSRNQTNFTIRITMSAFRRALERESGRTLISELIFQTYLPDSQINVKALCNFLSYLCDEIDQGNLNFNLPLIEKQYEQTILSLVLAELPHNHKEFIGMEALKSAPDCIRKVEKLVAKNFADYISLSEMAVCAGVSVRTLQNSFRRFRNITPMEFLRDYRLSVSRQLLTDDKHVDRNISKIATNCGFTHLSKFAKCYRKRYGESPSETRKKVPR
jgi:AraC-like DNA-binding protein